MQKYLIVYKCTDDGEEEACFLIDCYKDQAAHYCAELPKPQGFEDRPGYYSFKEYP